MKIYFLSSRPCALFLDGEFAGRTDLFERFADVCPKDNAFVRFVPEGALPVSFFLTERLRFSPPDGCEVYILRDGIAVYARDFPPSDFSLKIVAQERLGASLATVFRQGPLQLALETPRGFFVLPLPEEFSRCSVRAESGLIFLEGEGMLAAYTEGGKCVLSKRVGGYRFERGALVASLPLADCLKRTAECRWTLTEDGCFPDKFSVPAPEGIEEDILPCAFFESVLTGADFSLFLSDELKGRAGHIRAFLGDFSSVSLTKDPMTCGLARKKKDRLYELHYFTVTLEGGKIADIRG